MLVLGGLGLLLIGHKQAWFLGALATGRLHNQTYLVAWALVGAAYSLLASFMWLRWAGKPGRVKRVLGLVFLVGLVLAGSQVAARNVMQSVGVIILQVVWDQTSQEFVVYPASTNAAMTKSLIRGDLQPIVSIEGLWWSPSQRKSPQPLLTSEVEEFAVGAPDLLGQRRGTDVSPGYSVVGASTRGGEPRMPWKPRRVGTDSAFVVRVNAALVNRKGKRVGRVSTHYVSGGAYFGAVWPLPDPRRIRWKKFEKEGWAWLTDPARNQAPFRVRPPLPPVVFVEDVRVNPRK
ncbi:MAG: hypothetical protein O7H41_00995 [Planctomycetota bacterium]|nr:hypothetical protein [Planctomycetota bacterium]